MSQTSGAESAFDVVFGIVCDDIRFELGNKLSVMGTYNENAVVPSFPADLRLAVLGRITPRNLGPMIIQIRVTAPSRAVVLEGQVEVEVTAMSVVAVPLPPAFFNVQQEGFLTWEIREKSSDTWSHLARLRIDLAA